MVQIITFMTITVVSNHHQDAANWCPTGQRLSLMPPASKRKAAIMPSAKAKANICPFRPVFTKT